MALKIDRLQVQRIHEGISIALQALEKASEGSSMNLDWLSENRIDVTGNINHAQAELVNLESCIQLLLRGRFYRFVKVKPTDLYE